MTSDEILSIRLAERLFKGDATGVRRAYYDLAKAWHPDTCRDPKAKEVFQHLADLYQDAQNRMELGVFGCVTVRLFDFGQVYVGDESVTYLFEKQHHAHWARAAYTIAKLPFGSAAMRESIGKCVPMRMVGFNSPNELPGLRATKAVDSFILRDVVEYYKGKLDPRHAAWIVSSMINVACYLAFAKIAHHDISMDTFFVSPSQHVGTLMGGWEFAVPFGHRIGIIPARTFGLLPFSVQRSKTASQLTDLELVRATAREMTKDADLPAPMKGWIHGITTGDAVTDYEEWGNVLKQSFGARRFTPLELSPEALYPRN